MTLQQLHYALAVAERGSINEAARSLFISQPSLSGAIRELESEIRFPIFIRTNRGISVSAEGEAFLGYARQVVQQAELLEEKYLGTGPARQRFSVSTHHYAFAANAFVDLIREFGAEEYEFSLRETATWNIIEDVKTLRSELGILYLSRFNETVIRRFLKENSLVFTELFRARPHIFVSRRHPLAGRELVSTQELEAYPCLSIDQGEHNSFYFSEEILSTLQHKKVIRVTDRAALINMMIGVNAYTVATGVFPSALHGENIVAVRLDADEEIRVGTIAHKDVIPTRLGEIYLAALRRIADTIGS